jgi:protein TonB
LKPILNPTQRAEFSGGKQAFNDFIRANINLPQEARKIKGKVRVAFIVTKEGEICDVRITSKPNQYLDREVIRAIRIMPKWLPGINEGEICDCYYLLDIKF